MRLNGVLAGLCLSATFASAAERVNPAILIADMIQRYATCRSYQDSGVVQINVKGVPIGNPMSFKTRFLRPDHFRFEWTQTWNEPKFKADGTFTTRRVSGTSLIWCTPAGVREFYDSTVSLEGGTIKPVENLDLAVAGATGVSLGAAQTIPSLLTTRIHAFRLTELQTLSLLPEAKFAGVACHHITGRRIKPPCNYELWIGKSDLLLRKIRWSVANPADTVEESHRDIRINADIPMKAFEFAPHK